jgi:hypothetical protein
MNSFTLFINPSATFILRIFVLNPVLASSTEARREGTDWLSQAAECVGEGGTDAEEMRVKRWSRKGKEVGWRRRVARLLLLCTNIVSGSSKCFRWMS